MYRVVIFFKITEMLKKRYRKSEIEKILQDHKNGKSIPQIIYEHEISQSTFYNWRARYSSLSTEDKLYLAKIKQENDRLKRMFADLSLENLMLKWQLEKYQ
jgi:putative transposase